MCMYIVSLLYVWCVWYECHMPWCLYGDQWTVFSSCFSLPWAWGSYSVFRLAQQELLSIEPSHWPVFFVSKVLLLSNWIKVKKLLLFFFFFAIFWQKVNKAWNMIFLFNFFLPENFYFSFYLLLTILPRSLPGPGLWHLGHK